VRKKSKYKPKGVRLDVMTYVKSGLLPLTSVGSEAVKLKIINHDALNNLRMGTGTKMDFDTLVESMNVAEAFAMHNHGDDWRSEIRTALDALFDLGVRAKHNGMKFVMKSNELTALQTVLQGIIGFKRYYRRIDKTNFHYEPIEKLMDDSFIDDIEKMADCAVYVDEAYAARLFDSYRKTNMGVRQRMAIYTTRHFNRKIVIVAQRPNAIHVSSRALVNRFYKCSQPFPFLYRLFKIRFFTRTEFQEMNEESVNEEAPLSTRFRIGKKAIYRAYDSKYMRKGMETIYPPQIEDFDVSYTSRWKLLFRGLRLSKPPRFSGAAKPTPVPDIRQQMRRQIKIH